MRREYSVNRMKVVYQGFESNLQRQLEPRFAARLPGRARAPGQFPFLCAHLAKSRIGEALSGIGDPIPAGSAHFKSSKKRPAPISAITAHWLRLALSEPATVTRRRPRPRALARPSHRVTVHAFVTIFLGLRRNRTLKSARGHCCGAFTRTAPISRPTSR